MSAKMELTGYTNFLLLIKLGAFARGWCVLDGILNAKCFAAQFLFRHIKHLGTSTHNHIPQYIFYSYPFHVADQNQNVTKSLILVIRTPVVHSVLQLRDVKLNVLLNNELQNKLYGTPLLNQVKKIQKCLKYAFFCLVRAVKKVLFYYFKI